jgi:hypothetical protein
LSHTNRNFLSSGDLSNVIGYRFVPISNRITESNYDSMLLYLSGLYKWSKENRYDRKEHEISKRKYYALKTKDLLGWESLFPKVLLRILYFFDK